MRGDLVKNAKYDWAAAFLPYDPEIIKAPLNSIIGGASLWPMTAPGRTPEEYKAVAQFLVRGAKVWARRSRMLRTSAITGVTGTIVLVRVPIRLGGTVP
jgi:ABC-type glycerol-3-phosphate transport system substrate-binding protein